MGQGWPCGNGLQCLNGSGLFCDTDGTGNSHGSGGTVVGVCACPGPQTKNWSSDLLECVP